MQYEPQLKLDVLAAVLFCGKLQMCSDGLFLE